jgi:hypothetical protein
MLFNILDKKGWLLFLLFTDLTQTPTNLKQRQAFQKEISNLIGLSFIAYLNKGCKVQSLRKNISK